MERLTDKEEISLEEADLMQKSNKKVKYREGDEESI